MAEPAGHDPVVPYPTVNKATGAKIKACVALKIGMVPECRRSLQIILSEGTLLRSSAIASAEDAELYAAAGKHEKFFFLC